jgi:hypothetical protein
LDGFKRPGRFVEDTFFLNGKKFPALRCSPLGRHEVFAAVGGLDLASIVINGFPIERTGFSALRGGLMSASRKSLATLASLLMAQSIYPAELT